MGVFDNYRRIRDERHTGVSNNSGVSSSVNAQNLYNRYARELEDDEEESAFERYQKAKELNQLEKKKTGEIAPEYVNEANDRLSNLSDEQNRLIAEYVNPTKQSVGDRNHKAVADTRSAAEKRMGISSVQKSKKNVSDSLKNTGLNDDDIKSYSEAYKTSKEFSDRVARGDNMLDPTEQVKYGQAKIDSLSKDERNILGKQMADEESYKYKSMEVYNYGDSLSDYVIPTDQWKEDLKKLDPNKWTDDKIDEYAKYIDQIANYNTTNKFNSDHYEINKNASTGEKVWQSIVNTGHALNPINQMEGGIIGMLGGKDVYAPEKSMQGSWEYGVEQVANNAIGEDHPIVNYLYSNAVSTAQSYEKILTAAAVGNVVGATASALGATAETVAGITKFASQLVSLSTFGEQAYNSTYKDARERGISEEQSQKLGVLSGVIEAATELIPIDNLGRIFTRNKEGNINIIKDFLKQAGLEGLEEGESDILNRISDYLIVGKDGKNQMSLDIQAYEEQGMSHDDAVDQAERDFWKNTFLDILGGAISGGVMASGEMIRGYKASGVNKDRSKAISKAYEQLGNYEGDSNYAKSIRDIAEKYKNNPTQYLADNVIDDSTEQGKEAKAKLQGYADKEAEGKRLTASDRLNIERSIYLAEEASKESKSNARAAYAQYQRELSFVPDEYRAPVSNISVEDARKNMIEAAKSGDAQKLSDTYQAMKNSTSADMRSRADDIFDEFKGMAELNGISSEEYEGIKTTAQDAYLQGLRGNEVSNSINTVAREAYNKGAQERIEIGSYSVQNKADLTDKVNTANGTINVKSIKNGLIETTDGKSINVENITDPTIKSFYKAAALSDKGDIYSNAFLENYTENVNIENYRSAFNDFFNEGRSGASFDAVMKGSVAQVRASRLGNDVVKAMYDAGAKQRAVDSIAKAIRNNLNYRSQGRVVYEKGINKSLFAESIASVSGLEVRVVNDFVDKKMFADNVVDFLKEKGKAFDEAKVREIINNEESLSDIADALDLDLATANHLNGARADYSAKEGTITLKTSDLASVFHELTHFGQNYAEEEYNILKQTVLDALATRSEVFAGEWEAYRKTYKGITSSDEISDEFVASAMVGFMSTKEGQEAFIKALDKNCTADQKKSILGKVKDFFKKLLDSLSNIVKTSNMSSYERAVMNSKIKDTQKIVDQWVAMFEKASETHRSMDSEEINKEIKKVGLEYDAKAEMVYPSDTQYSNATWRESGFVKDRENAIKVLANTIGVSEKKAESYIDQINSVASFIIQNANTLDYIALDDAGMLMDNSEYTKTVDGSTLCKKRLEYTDTLSAIQRKMPNTALTGDEMLSIVKMMQDKGYTTPCGLCYVESTRRQLPTYAKDFLEQYAKENPGKYVPNMAEINTPDGLVEVRAKHPEVFKAFNEFMNAKGQAKPKLFQTRAAYQVDEITDFFKMKRGKKMVWNKNKVAKFVKNGGLRLQSYSDFEVVQMIDMMQVIMDMSMVDVDTETDNLGTIHGMISQAYTKVPLFADIFGGTGVKINLSTIAKGVDSNGNLIFDDVEGINSTEAKALRQKYSKDVGIVTVVFNDAQLEAALKNPEVDYVLPFHISSWSMAQARSITGQTNLKDYTHWQNEKKPGVEKLANYMPNEYWDFSKNGRANAEKYLEMCNADGRIPKFYFLLESTKDGYKLPKGEIGDNYFKLLIDFKMYDNKGKGSPQTAVRPEFNMEAANKALAEYQGDHNVSHAKQDIVDQFVEEYKDQHGDVRYSIGINDSIFNDENGNEHKGYDLLTPIEQMRIEEDVKSFRNGDKTKLTRTHNRKKVLRVKGADTGYNKVVVLDQWNYGIRVSKIYELQDNYYINKDDISKALVKGEKNGEVHIVKEFAENVCGRSCIVEYILDTNKTNADAFARGSRGESEDSDRDNKSEENRRGSDGRSEEAKAYSLDVDSDGKELSKGQKEYFKDSKAIDENGKLLVMYHGTNNDFTEFKSNEYIGEVNGVSKIKGYFSTNPEYSEAYGNVSPYYLNVKNPLFINPESAMSLKDWSKWFKAKGISVRFDSGIQQDALKGYVEKDGSKKYIPFELFDSSEYWYNDGNLTEQIEKAGYDSVMWYEGYNDDDIAIMPFDSNAIKRTDNLNPSESNDTRYSLTVDSEGRELSEGQRKHFDNSEAINENGELVRVFHGTLREFYEFDQSYSNVEGDVGKGFYFTNNPDDVEENYANRNGADFTNKVEREAELIYDDPFGTEYEDMDLDEIVESLKDKYATSKDPITMECYLNIENPVYIGNYNGHNSTYLLEGLTSDINEDDYADEDEYLEALDEALEEKIEDIMLHIEDSISFLNSRSYDDLRSKLYEIAMDDGIRFEDLKDELGGMGLDDENGDFAENEVARLIAEALGYDGIIDNTVSQKFRGMKLNPDTVHFIVFSSNQAKLITNENPTSSSDVRYSMRVDSDGKALTKAQREYFKDSKMVNEDGSLKVMYHGSQAANITIFDPKYSDDQISLFFTDRPDVAKTYGDEQYKVYLNLVNPLVVEGYNGYWNRIPYGDVRDITANKTEVDGFIFNTADEAKAFDDKYHLTEIKQVYADAMENGEAEYNGAVYDEYEAEDLYLGAFYDAESEYRRYHQNNSVIKTIKDFFDNYQEYGWFDLHKVMLAYDHNAMSLSELKETGFTYEEAVQETLQMFKDDAEENGLSLDSILDNEVYILPHENEKVTLSDEKLTTRQIAKKALAEGYDGVIFKNISDTKVGLYALSDVAIAFNSNQIKSVNNLNPTENNDYRYSINVDSWLDEMTFDEDAPEVANILTDGLQTLKTKKVNKDVVKKVATDIKSQYGSNIGIEKLTDMIEKAFRGIQSDVASYDDALRIFKEIATPVIEQSTTKVGGDLYTDFIQRLSGHKIKLNASQLAEVKQVFGSYDAFKKALPQFTFNTKEGTSLDSLWGEMVEQSGYVLEADEAVGSQPIALYDAVQAMKPTVVNNFGGDAEEVAKDCALRIIEDYLNESGDAKAKEAVNKVKATQNEFRSRVRQNYQTRLQEAKKALREKEAYTKKNADYNVVWKQAEAKKKADEKIAKIKEDYNQRLRDAKAKAKSDAEYQYKKQKLEADWREAELKARQEARIAEINERNAQNIKDVRATEQWKLAELNTKRLDQIADIKARAKNDKKEQLRRQQVKHEREQISRVAKKLMRWITNPTDKNHVPKKLQDAMIDMFNALDFVEPEVMKDAKGNYYITNYRQYVLENGHKKYGRFTGKTKEEVLTEYHNAQAITSNNAQAWADRMMALNDILSTANRAVNDSDISQDADLHNFLQLIDPDLAAEFNDLLRRNRGQVGINNLDVADLKTIKNTLRGIAHWISNANRMFTSDLNVDEVVQDTLATQGRNRLKDHTRIYNRIAKNLIVDMATPETAFELQGGKVKQLFDAFNKGFERKTRDIKQASEYMAELLKDIDPKEVKKWTGEKAKRIGFSLEDGDIELSIAHIMSLYELKSRPEALQHILVGGIETDPVTHGLFKTEHPQNKAVHVTMEEINRIVDSLSPEQKRVADGIQKFMANECSAWGNEASEMMYNYDKFLDPNYFPMQTDADTHATTNQNAFANLLNGIEHMGFTKALTSNADNALVITDIFDVMSKHVTQMAAYHSYAPVVKDTLRWLNYKARTDNTDGTQNTTSVKKAINSNFGRIDNAGVEYFEKFLKDINESEKSADIMPFWNNLIGNYKGAAVGANLRVVVQQPTAYVRAANMIKPKYLIKALPKIFTSSKEMKRITEISPTAYWKSQGYYETNMGKSLKEIITGISTPRDQIIEKSMWLAGKADDITWACLYNAIEMEQRAQYKGQGLTDEEFTEKVNERFRDVIAQTQVVDATIQKSQWMRAKGVYSKLLTSFMAEPTKSYNMAVKSMLQDYRDHGNNVIKWKSARKAMIVLLLTDLLTSLAQSLMDGLRYSEDDDDYWDTMIEYFNSNLKDNVNPLNRIPGLKDVTELIKNAITGETNYGQSSGQLMDASAIESVMDMVGTSSKLIQGNYNKTGYAAYMTYAKGISNLTGIPVYNLSRDAASFWNLFADDEYRLRKKVEGKNDKYKKFYESLNEEESDAELIEAINKAMNKGGTVEDIKSGIGSKYKSQYMDAFAEDDEETMADLKNIMLRGYKAAGYTESDLDDLLASWTEEKVAYSLIDDAIESGEGIQEAIKALQDADKKDDNIIEHIMNAYQHSVEYERTEYLDSGIEDNVQEALRILNTDYDKAKKDLAEKAKKAAEEKAAKAKKNEAKSKAYEIIDSGSGDYKSAINEWVQAGAEASDIKSTMTSDYVKPYVKAYMEGDSNAQAILVRIATVKAYMDQQTGLKIAKKYRGDYYKYEMDQIYEMMDKYQKEPW